MSNRIINITPKTSRIFNFYTAIVLMLLLALALAVTMAVTSGYDHHPDERVHFEAARYYSANHWLPPAIGDPDTLDSYSNYGKSRLNLPDYYYLLAGKFTALLSIITGDLILSARLFNVFLFLILILLCLRIPGQQRLLFGVLLITPQIWYIFSYVNSDAFALFLTIVITTQLVNDDSLLKQYLNSTGYSRSFYKSIPLILLIFLLFQAKANYYVYFIFLLIWGLWFLYARSDRKQLIIKYLLMVSLLVVLLLARNGLDYVLYGPDKGDQIKEMQEITAEEDYKPSVRRTDEGNPDLNLKERGVPYQDLFNDEYNWHRKTFYSFSGAYDYFIIFGTALYYRLMTLLYIFVALFALYQLWRKGPEARFFLVCTALLAALLLYLAFNFSWESSFQPQGRYLFPMLGIAAFLLGRYCNELGRHFVFKLSLVALTALSAYSFIAYGLVHIPKG